MLSSTVYTFQYREFNRRDYFMGVGQHFKKVLYTPVGYFFVCVTVFGYLGKLNI